MVFGKNSKRIAMLAVAGAGFLFLIACKPPLRSLNKSDETEAFIASHVDPPKLVGRLGYPRELDFGIYWFGFDESGHANVAQKAVKGVVNPYFKPQSPTLLYVHGWQKGNVDRRYDEGFNFPLVEGQMNVADEWIKKGWNVGIFYWTQFADEAEASTAEAKIWANSGSQKGLQWYQGARTSSVNGGHNRQNVTELFWDSYSVALENYQGSHIRLVGVSLGNQLVVRLAEQVGVATSKLKPSRVVLLEPGYSVQADAPNFSNWNLEKAKIQLTNLQRYGIAVELFRMTSHEGQSAVQAPFLAQLKKLSSLIFVSPGALTDLENNKRRALLALYMNSMGNPYTHQCAPTASEPQPAGAAPQPPPSANNVDDNYIKSIALSGKYWILDHDSGQRTYSTPCYRPRILQ